jgi:succinyl-CoA synthetase beta subunit
VITKDGRLLALDGKMVIDDNSLYRHPEIAEMRDINGDLPEERQARKFGLSYVKLDGDIGCLVNGAGLAMATMDVIKLYGGEPANFLDIGGGASADKVSAALGIILQDPGVKVVLINIFGGITRGDEVARGIMKALKKLKPQIPIVARLAGTNEEEGQKLLAKTDLIMAKSLAGAAQEAVSMAQEVKQA